MKYYQLFLSVAFAASGVYNLITKGCDDVYGWFSIMLSCGFAVFFIRDTAKNDQIRKIFSIIAKVVLCCVILFLLLGGVVFKI